MAAGGFSNVYEDDRRAEAYSKLEFPGTYYLAFRDLPEILRRHVRGGRAFDFGCGTGRSTRLLRELGFDAVGVDISRPMVARAHELDPGGRYEVVPDGDLSAFPEHGFDLALSAFTFDNVPTRDKKIALFTALEQRLRDEGRIVNLVSAPEIYLHEWASFTTKAFPENARACSGDRVRIVMLDVEDDRPVEDVLWTDEAWRDVYASAGLAQVAAYRPLATGEEGTEWGSETEIAPWVLYVLAPSRGA